ncbi:MAG: hypothetical protein K2X04_06635 [Burkholderiales bacterium]|nr:hypothetical protein [Burkholderiales bacterium]
MNFLNRKRNILRRNNLLFALTIILISIGIHLYLEADSSKQNTIHTKLQNQLAQNKLLTLIQDKPTSSNDKLRSKRTALADFAALHSSMILPYGENHSSTTDSSATPYSLGSNLFHPRRTVTFNNLTNNMEPTNSSSFTCPHDLPFAIDYQLESTTQSKTLYGQVYKNVCMGQPGGSANNDILYGENQNIDSFGKTEQMTAFKPIDQPEGCHLAINNIKASIKISENTTIVTPVTTIVDNKPITIGYKQTTNLNINCLQICNSMLNHICAAGDSINITYCKQSISAAYQRSNIYYLRNIRQNFCACEVNSGDYKFTNAVDIESAISYYNRLSAVTCSNIQQ